MATVLFHPKNGNRCALCKRWIGKANVQFQSAHTGFKFDINVMGKCAANNSNQYSSAGHHCKNYSPSVEADRLL